MQLLFWLGILLTPFYNVLLFRPGNFELSVVDVVFLLVFTLWTVRVLISMRMNMNLPLLLILLFLTFSLFSILISVEVMVGLKRWGRTLLRIAFFGMMMPSLMKQSKRPQMYIYLFIASGILFGILNYIDFFLSPLAFIRNFFEDPVRLSANLRFIYPDENNRGGANYGHEIGHWQSSVLLLMLVLFLNSSGMRLRFGLILSMIASGVCFLFSFTKSAWIGFAFGLLYIAYRQFRATPMFIGGNIFKFRLRAVMLPLLLVGVPVLTGLLFWFFVLPEDSRNLILMAFTFQDITSTQRLDVWQNLLPIIRENLIFGVGWGNLIARNISFDPHNWWLGMLAEAGLVGFVLYGIAYWAILYLVDLRLRRLPKEIQLLALGANAALLSLGVAGLFEMSFMWSMDTWFVIGLGIFFVQAKQSGGVETV